MIVTFRGNKEAKKIYEKQLRNTVQTLLMNIFPLARVCLIKTIAQKIIE